MNFGTADFARLVNAATAVFAADSFGRKRPISSPSLFPRSGIAFNFNPSLPRKVIFGITAAARIGPSDRSSVSIALISATLRGRM
jgi:hypothetical protein